MAALVVATEPIVVRVDRVDDAPPPAPGIRARRPRPGIGGTADARRPGLAVRRRALPPRRLPRPRRRAPSPGPAARSSPAARACRPRRSWRRPRRCSRAGRCSRSRASRRASFPASTPRPFRRNRCSRPSISSSSARSSGFSAYLWLLRVTTASRVSTYAYVNPIVAVLLGWALAGEALTPRVFVAAAVIVGAVALIIRHGGEDAGAGRRRARTSAAPRRRRRSMPDSGAFRRPATRGQLVLAFAAVYVLWGSTYLAIRFGVETIPPFLMAGLRHLTAGLLLFGWLRLRGTPAPERRHWGPAAAIGGLMLLGGNGLVSWAEQRVPSGLAALIVASRADLDDAPRRDPEPPAAARDRARRARRGARRPRIPRRPGQVRRRRARGSPRGGRPDARFAALGDGLALRAAREAAGLDADGDGDGDDRRRRDPLRRVDAASASGRASRSPPSRAARSSRSST